MYLIWWWETILKFVAFMSSASYFLPLLPFLQEGAGGRCLWVSCCDCFRDFRDPPHKEMQ